MTQLILDGVVLPESKKGGYLVENRPLSKDIEMTSGRIVREIRGNVWVVSYQYGYFNEELKNQVLAACERGKKQAISCGFLKQESAGELSYSDFFVTNVRRPKFMWSSDGSPMWGDFYVELREVRPHD
jgi:hypothetical protein